MDSWVVPVALLGLLLAAAVVVRLRHYRSFQQRRRSRVLKDGTVELDGPPVPDALQLVFGGYVGGRKVTGLVTLKEGIKVAYEDGSSYTFIAVPEGAALHMKVTEPE